MCSYARINRVRAPNPASPDHRDDYYNPHASYSEPILFLVQKESERREGSVGLLTAAGDHQVLVKTVEICEEEAAGSQEVL